MEDFVASSVGGIRCGVFSLLFMAFVMLYNMIRKFLVLLRTLLEEFITQKCLQVDNIHDITRVSKELKPV